MKITTADCRNWLVADARVQEIVADRSGYSDYLSGAEPKSSVQMTWVTDGKNPAKWKRQAKYKIGSKTDLDRLDYANDERVVQCAGVDPTGGTVRTFWLENTDHVTIDILELSGKLYFLDDLSD